MARYRRLLGEQLETRGMTGFILCRASGDGIMHRQKKKLLFLHMIVCREAAARINVNIVSEASVKPSISEISRDKRACVA